jgi:hypothetical protein
MTWKAAASAASSADADSLKAFVTSADKSVFAYLRSVGALKRSGERTAACPVRVAEASVPFRADTDALGACVALGLLVVEEGDAPGAAPGAAEQLLPGQAQ